MLIKQWLVLASFIWLALVPVLFTNSPLGLLIAEEPSCELRPQLRQASISELQQIPGIRLKKARLIRAFVLENPEIKLESLLEIRGIGPKTIRRLEEYFAY